MRNRAIACLLSLVLFFLAGWSAPPSAAEEAPGIQPVRYEDFLRRFTMLLGPVYEAIMGNTQNTVVETEGTLGEVDAQGRTPFLIQGFLPGGEGILLEGYLLDDVVLSFSITIDQSSFSSIAFPLSFALLPIDSFGEESQAKDLFQLAKAMLSWHYELYPQAEGREEIMAEVSEMDETWLPIIILISGQVCLMSPMNGYNRELTESDADRTYTISVSLADPPQLNLLASEEAPPSKEPEEDWIALSDEELAYFTLNNYKAKKFEWTESLVLLRFVENGQQRYMLTYFDDDGVLYDYFNNRKAFFEPSHDKKHMGLMNDYEWVGPVSSSESPQNEKMYYYEDSFPPGTVIRWLREASLGFGWYRDQFPGRDMDQYDSVRDYYLRAFPAEERFPRAAALKDHPQSLIPRTHDNEPLGSLSETGIITLNYETMTEPKSSHEVVFFVREEGESVYDLFSGERLFTYGEASDYNTAFLESLREGSRPVISDDYFPGINDFQRCIDRGKQYTQSNNEVSSYYQYGLFYEQAKTVGDLRRVYEMLPQGNWYIAPKAEEGSVAEFVPPKPSFHAVANETELRDAIQKAKKGDTIVLLRDISIYSSIRLEKKKLTLMGADGHQPTLRLYPGEYNNTLFQMMGSTLEVRNLRLTNYETGLGFDMYEGSKLVLGENVLVEHCGNIAYLQGKSSLTIDGARVTGSGAFFIMNASKLHMKSGEIDNNSINNLAILNIDYKSEFVMEGGSIHHNSRSATETPEAVVAVKGGKMTLKGGSIHDNKGAYYGAVYLQQSQLVMEGGEIRDNTTGWSVAGGLNVDTSTVQMKGGLIANNIGSGGANNVEMRSWEKSSFDMRGGAIEQSLEVYRRTKQPSVYLEGEGVTFTYRGGELNTAHVRAVKNAKFVNKVKKK